MVSLVMKTQISKFCFQTPCKHYQNLFMSEEEDNAETGSIVSEQKEIERLNAQIDELNVVLNEMEKKNDHIQHQLLEVYMDLLKSNREMRAARLEKQQN